MNTNTKILFTFIGGAAIGGLISFAILREKYDQMLEEETEAMQKYYEQGETEPEENPKQEKDDNVNIAYTKDSLGNMHDTHEKAKKRTYVDYVKKYNPNELVEERLQNEPDPLEGLETEDGIDWEMEDEEDEYNDAPPEDPPESPFTHTEPYIISRQDFEEENLHYDKITITYYDIDDVLADEREDVIPDIESVIGIDALTNFGNMSNDPNIVYVRNDRLGADYEVCLTNDSYTESVLGIIER